MVAMMCACCQSYKKAKTEAMAVSNINTRLKKLLLPYKRQESMKKNRKYRRIQMENRHFHMTCGRCLKFNYNTLMQNEKSIYENIVFVCQLIDEDHIAAETVHAVLNLLRGEYPLYYRLINERLQKRKICPQKKSICHNLVQIGN